MSRDRMLVWKKHRRWLWTDLSNGGTEELTRATEKADWSPGQSRGHSNRKPSSTRPLLARQAPTPASVLCPRPPLCTHLQAVLNPDPCAQESPQVSNQDRGLASLCCRFTALAPVPAEFSESAGSACPKSAQSRLQTSWSSSAGTPTAHFQPMGEGRSSDSLMIRMVEGFLAALVAVMNRA